MVSGSVTKATLKQLFEEACPYYLSIGMTWSQFWEQDVKIAEQFRKADELKKERDNLMAWLYGRYVYDALCEASPLFRFSMKGGRTEPMPYNSEPYPITEAEAEEREKREQKRLMERMKMQFMEYASRVARLMESKSRNERPEEDQDSAERKDDGRVNDQ